MSLLDTIKGAREEAEANSLRAPKKDMDVAADTTAEEQPSSPSGFSKRSAARAKPAREAAGTVRTGPKPRSEMTKEEKRAIKAEKRDAEDLIYDVKKAVLESNEDYQRTQKIWWGLLIAGIACTICSWLAINYVQGGGEATSTLTTISVALMVIAYVLIIGAFIYDMIKVRPLRKQADAKIVGMSKRRMKQVAEEAAEAKRQKKAAK